MGEDIPVPYSVAQEVGRLRRLEDYHHYNGDGPANATLAHYLEEQRAKAVLPSDRVITLEIGKRLAILNVCFGTKINETLAKMLSTLLSARLGESVGVTTDPYRIILDLPRDIKPATIVETLRSIRTGTVEGLLRMVIRNSSHLRWRFVYVAKKFGAVDKEADYRNINFNRLIEAYEDTVLLDEAVDKVLWEDLDLLGTAEVISGLESEEIAVHVCGLSPIGEAGLQHSKELITPSGPTTPS